MKKIDIACIIDDDPIFVLGTKRVMELADFCNSFLIFNNGKEALHTLSPRLALGENLPDIIFLDLNMPVMDGWEFLDEFIKIPSPKKITTFIVTSSINQADMQKATQYNEVSNYIVKPITINMLKELLASW